MEASKAGGRDSLPAMEAASKAGRPPLDSGPSAGGDHKRSPGSADHVSWYLCKVMVPRAGPPANLGTKEH